MTQEYIQNRFGTYSVLKCLILLSHTSHTLALIHPYYHSNIRLYTLLHTLITEYQPILCQKSLTQFPRTHPRSALLPQNIGHTRLKTPTLFHHSSAYSPKTTPYIQRATKPDQPYHCLSTQKHYHKYHYTPTKPAIMPAEFPRRHSHDELTTLHKSPMPKCTLINRIIKLVKRLTPPLKYMRCRSWRAENDWSCSQEESDFYAPRPEEYAMNI